MARVLIIDDEPRITEFVERALSASGLSVEVATSGAAGLEAARAGHYDLVVLDLMMPGISGLGVLRALMQASPQQNVLVLSALSDVESKVRCLELGAADYLVKPFALAELIARVWARLRQSGGGPGAGVIRAGGLTLDPQRRTADPGTGPVALSDREYRLLQYLAAHEGSVCTRAELLENVWDSAFDVGTNVIEVCVSRLRTKLGRSAVETIRNAGYSLPRHATLA